MTDALESAAVWLLVALGSLAAVSLAALWLWCWLGELHRDIAGALTVE